MRNAILLVGAAMALSMPAAAQPGKKGKPESPSKEAKAAEPPEDAKNLVPNSGFEKPAKDGTHPAHWQKVDNLVFHWVEDPAGKRGKVMKIDTDLPQSQAYSWWRDLFVHGADLSEAPDPKPTQPPKYGTVAGVGGGFYVSGYIPIEKGKAYRVYVDAKGPTSKVFAFGYEEKEPLHFGDEQPHVQQQFRKARGEPDFDEDGRPIRYFRRYRYRRWFAVGGSDEWKTYSHDKPLHPTSRQITEDVRWLRIQLYPYWPPDTYWYDNVEVYETAPGPNEGKPDATEHELNTGKVVE